MKTRPLTPTEQKYTYAQSMQLEGQTGTIGHLRGDFATTGYGFYTTWFDTRPQWKSDEFKADLDTVINALRKDKGLLHLYPMDFGMKHADGSPAEYSVQIIKNLEERVDVILPGEIIDWTVVSYIRDAVQQGRTKAMINIGHLNWEELGMKYACEWVGELVEHKIPVTYVPSEDMYRFVVK
ncbi:MAG: hypothetical protein Q4D50_00815 [Eubacteriales bacterium]|nr:hypothetical protein [Eubacteriales bacterium]